MSFQTGQRVRLAANYIGKSLGYRSNMNVASKQRELRLIPAGTTFTVCKSDSGRDRRLRLDGPTVLVTNDEGTWCIPERLLEAVEAGEQPQPTESGRDAEGGRVG